MIAITVKEDIKNSSIESCFGKSVYFYIFNPLTGKGHFMKNPYNESGNHSGRKAASMLIKEGVATVISSNFGIQVKKIFDKHKIQMVIIPEEIKYLEQITEKRKSG